LFRLLVALAVLMVAANCLQEAVGLRIMRSQMKRPMLIAALLLWMVPLLVITVLVARNPSRRSAMIVYHQAADYWMAQAPLYTNPLEYNYLPVYAPLYAPFHWMPVPVGDVLWRWMAAALLASGLWRLTRGSDRAFLIATALALSLSLGALRNGQANALLAGLVLHAAACLSREQWKTAALLIALSVAVKPIALTLAMLAPLVYRKLFWPLVAALVLLAALPFALGAPAYVLEQHRAFVANLRFCSTVTTHRFADLNGMFRTFGVELPSAISLAVRVIAGAATAIVWWCARRMEEPQRALWLYLLATTYLMLFNPMTETNGYVVVVPALALWAERVLSQPALRTLGWVLVGIVVAMSLFSPTRFSFKLFWYPAMTMVFFGLVSALLWSKTSSHATDHRES